MLNVRILLRIRNDSVAESVFRTVGRDKRLTYNPTAHATGYRTLCKSYDRLPKTAAASRVERDHHIFGSRTANGQRLFKVIEMKVHLARSFFPNSLQNGEGEVSGLSCNYVPPDGSRATGRSQRGTTFGHDLATDPGSCA